MAGTTNPEKKALARLIVVVAFDKTDEGELVPAYGPNEQQSEERAIRVAEGLAAAHAGVIAWSRTADPDLGDYGAPVTLFVAGEVPDME